MISQIRGTVIKVESSSVIIDVAGVGFEVQVACSSNISIDGSITLHTYMHWNQENGPSMFGFTSEIEKVVFKMIISCSGVGPKIALAVLRDLTTQDFIRAVTTHDIKLLSSVSGIGTKKAEQMIVQLNHKVAKLLESGVSVCQGATVHLKDVSDALASLNYSRTEINRAMQYIHETAVDKNYSFDQLFRQALSFLSKRT